MANPTRAQGMRDANKRPDFAGHRSRLDVNLAALPPDMEVLWVRDSYLGENDRDNLQDAMDRRGFRPATLGEFPEAGGRMLPGEQVNPHALIRRGGLVLMVRPKDWGDDERAAIAQEHRETLQSVARAPELAAQLDGKLYAESAQNRVQSGTGVTTTRPPASRPPIQE